jgi:signal transduction histidine kinase
MEAVGQLTGGIAHDFNNMLAVIMGGLNLLQRKLAKGETDVGRFVDAALDGARRAAGLWRIHADPGQLENAILNLCVNARDAMPQGGKLTIETANAVPDDFFADEYAIKAGPYVLIAVTDTGVGMDADVIAKAFDPFFTTKGVAKGTGLGLSQVYGFVRQSGGQVRIYSEEGVGTTVKVYLPRHEGATAGSAALEEARSPYRGSPTAPAPCARS